MATAEGVGSTQPETPAAAEAAGSSNGGGLELRDLTKHFGDVVAVERISEEGDGNGS